MLGTCQRRVPKTQGCEFKRAVTWLETTVAELVLVEVLSGQAGPGQGLGEVFCGPSAPTSVLVQAALSQPCTPVSVCWLFLMLSVHGAPPPGQGPVLGSGDLGLVLGSMYLVPWGPGLVSLSPHSSTVGGGHWGFCPQQRKLAAPDGGRTSLVTWQQPSQLPRGFACEISASLLSFVPKRCGTFYVKLILSFLLLFKRSLTVSGLPFSWVWMDSWHAVGCEKARQEDTRDDAVVRLAGPSCAHGGNAPLAWAAGPWLGHLLSSGMDFSWQDEGSLFGAGQDLLGIGGGQLGMAANLSVVWDWPVHGRKGGGEGGGPGRPLS